MTTAANPRKKSPRHREVLPVSEARKEFSSILKSFSEEDQTEPVYIGAHRKAEAVLIPVSVWEEMLDLVDDLAISKIVKERGDGPFIRTSVAELAAEIGLDYPPQK